MDCFVCVFFVGTILACCVIEQLDKFATAVCALSSLILFGRESCMTVSPSTAFSTPIGVEISAVGGARAVFFGMVYATISFQISGGGRFNETSIARENGRIGLVVYCTALNLFTLSLMLSGSCRPPASNGQEISSAFAGTMSFSGTVSNVLPSLFNETVYSDGEELFSTAKRFSTLTFANFDLDNCGSLGGTLSV